MTTAPSSRHVIVSQPLVAINNCTGVRFGNVFNFTSSTKNEPKMSRSQVELEKRAYVKTETIAEMMKSEEMISNALLDFTANSFGHRWKDLTIALKISDLEVEGAIEDFKADGGNKGVMYELLTSYFKHHPEMRILGIFITFLWDNDFNKTVTAIKDQYKELKKLEKLGSTNSIDNDESGN